MFAASVAVLDLHEAANACAAVATAGFSDEQAANGQAVVEKLRALFLPRVAVMASTALASDAPLLNILPGEILVAVLHRLNTRDLFRFSATCRALYRHAPPQQESVVAVVLEERAQNRGCVAGPSTQGVADLLRREWQHALAGQPPLMASIGAGQVSAFIDSTGRLLTCGTEGVGPDIPGLPSEWAIATTYPYYPNESKVLASPTIVPAMRDVSFRCIASGFGRCFAVSSEGRVYSWGAGERHLGHDEPYDGAVVDGLDDVHVRTVSLGCSYDTVFAAVTENGLLFTWGSIDSENDLWVEGPSGIGYPASETDGGSVEVSRQVILSDVCVRSVALGHAFSLILADDGRLFSCGLAEHGVLGHGNQDQNVVRPKQIEALRGVRVRGVAAGNEVSLAVTTEGRVYSWGALSVSGHAIHAVVLLPTLMEALSRVSLVAADENHACAVTEDGALFTWGFRARFGSLGHGDEMDQLTPRRVEALRGCRIATVALGDYHTLVAAEDGSVYGFGLSSRLGLGTASHESQLTPKRIPNLKVWLG